MDEPIPEVFQPDRVVLTRREDGRFDLAAECSVGDGMVGELTMILENADLLVRCRVEWSDIELFSPRVHSFPTPRAVDYSMSISAPMVANENGYFMVQRIKSGGCDE